MLIGWLTALFIALLAISGLFNRGRFLLVLVFVAAYYTSATSFSIFISSFSDSPQTATDLATLVLVGFFGLFYGIDLPRKDEFSQHFCCLFPQLGSLSLTASSIRFHLCNPSVFPN
jgi:hypothetical protein